MATKMSGKILKNRKNNTATHKAASTSPICINGVVITKPISKYKPEELGVRYLSSIAFNNLGKDTPEIAKLTIINDDTLTEYRIQGTAQAMGGTAYDYAFNYMLEASEFCDVIANISGDKEGVNAAKELKDVLGAFLLDETTYPDVKAKAEEIAKKPSYNGVMNVLLTALRVGYSK